MNKITLTLTMLIIAFFLSGSTIYKENQIDISNANTQSEFSFKLTHNANPNSGCKRGEYWAQCNLPGSNYNTSFPGACFSMHQQ